MYRRYSLQEPTQSEIISNPGQSSMMAAVSAFGFADTAIFHSQEATEAAMSGDVQGTLEAAIAWAFTGQAGNYIAKWQKLPGVAVCSVGPCAIWYRIATTDAVERCDGVRYDTILCNSMISSLSEHQYQWG